MVFVVKVRYYKRNITCCSNDGKKFSKSPNGKYTKCCESGILDNNGKCCAKTDGLDGKGFCCPKNDICGNGVCCQNNNDAYGVNGNMNVEIMNVKSHVEKLIAKNMKLVT